MSTEARLPIALAAREMEKVREDIVDALRTSRHDALRNAEADLARIRDSDAVSMVLVGQHDAGKSSLLRCLTGRTDIAVGAGPTTTTSTRYSWDGHFLVDTPGVLAGVDAGHDMLAWEALAVADVVVFVTTVEGLDDATAAYFAKIRSRLRSLSALIFVVNKVLSERSDPAVVAEDLLGSLGPVAEMIPMAWTDARRWLEAQDHEDPARARIDSGVQLLADLLTETARGSGAQIRLLTVLRAWSEQVQRALRALSESAASGEEPSLRELDELLGSLVDQHEQGRQQVQLRADGAMSALRSDLLTAGPELDEPTLSQLVKRAYDGFEVAVTQDGVDRDGALELRLTSATPPAGTEVEVPPVDVRALVQRSLSQVAAMFGGAGARPGGAGHRLVYGAWKAVGKNFKPWGAVKASRTIGRVAGRANVGLTVGMVGWELLQARKATRAAEARARAATTWRTEAGELAEGIVRPWREQALTTIDTLHDVRWRDVARQRLTVLSSLAEQDEEAAHLTQLDDRISRLMDILDGQAEAASA